MDPVLARPSSERSVFIGGYIGVLSPKQCPGSLLRHQRLRLRMGLRPPRPGGDVHGKGHEYRTDEHEPEDRRPGRRSKMAWHVEPAEGQERRSERPERVRRDGPVPPLGEERDGITDRDGCSDECGPAVQECVQPRSAPIAHAGTIVGPGIVAEAMHGR
jgi:hypothetical protein